MIALMSFPPISPTRTNAFLKKVAQSVIKGNNIVSNYMEKQKTKMLLKHYEKRRYDETFFACTKGRLKLLKPLKLSSQ